MDIILSCIENKTVYPILIKNNGNHYLTLYYYANRSESLLHRDTTKNILYFQSTKDMEAFCKRNDLRIENDIVEYDFETPIENPIDYKRVLENWNLLNTIAHTFGMFFEGDSKKYNSVYDLLFRLITSINSIPPIYRVCEKDYKYILTVFRKKDRFLNCFELY